MERLATIKSALGIGAGVDAFTATQRANELMGVTAPAGALPQQIETILDMLFTGSA